VNHWQTFDLFPGAGRAQHGLSSAARFRRREQLAVSCRRQVRLIAAFCFGPIRSIGAVANNLLEMVEACSGRPKYSDSSYRAENQSWHAAISIRLSNVVGFSSGVRRGARSPRAMPRHLQVVVDGSDGGGFCVCDSLAFFLLGQNYPKHTRLLVEQVRSEPHCLLQGRNAAKRFVVFCFFFALEGQRLEARKKDSPRGFNGLKVEGRVRQAPKYHLPLGSAFFVQLFSRSHPLRSFVRKPTLSLSRITLWFWRAPVHSILPASLVYLPDLVASQKSNRL